jgi:hypothetical protein
MEKIYIVFMDRHKMYKKEKMKSPGKGATLKVAKEEKCHVESCIY